LPPDIIKCVNIALVCNRLEELIYGDVSHSKNDALEIIQAEASEGVWPHEEAGLLTKLLAS
jgi:putative two-component system response regulator